MSFARAERRRIAKALAKAERREQVRVTEMLVSRARNKRLGRESSDLRIPRKRVKALRPGQPDTRDDKYLHSHARGMRALVTALSSRAA